MRIIAFADGSFHKKLYIWRPQETSHQKTKLFEAFKATAGSEYFSIAQRIVRVIYDFGENLSLKYEHFFAEEYSSLSAYLEAEEELAEEEIEAIIKAEMGDESLWKVDVTICEGYGFANMFDEYIWKEDYLIPRLNEILEN
mgnify:FL=1